MILYEVIYDSTRTLQNLTIQKNKAAQTQFFVGIGASANRFLSGKDILIAQHKTEWEIFVELTKRLEDWLEVSLQYRRGLSNLGRLYYYDQFTNRDGFIKHFSEAYALSIAYVF